MTGIAGNHHVFSIEHLLGELGHGQSTVLLRTSRGKRSKTRHEKVKPWEGNHADGEFPEISVELTWEPEAVFCKLNLYHSAKSYHGRGLITSFKVLN